MRIAILQSCYIPWKGYFDIIGSVDTFVVYDDVQYEKGHWHNRNRIKTQHGAQWLTVPVSKAEGAFQTIEDTRLPLPFAEKHWRTISQAYARAPHFPSFGPRLQALYREAENFRSLSVLNLHFIKAISAELDLAPTFVRSSEIVSPGRKTDRLLAICRELGATRYLSGPAAKTYLEVEKFEAAGITVEWMDYSGYPDYPQLHGPFEHAVSVVDLLMNTGPEARRYMKAPLFGSPAGEAA